MYFDLDQYEEDSALSLILRKTKQTLIFPVVSVSYNLCLEEKHFNATTKVYMCSCYKFNLFDHLLWHFSKVILRDLCAPGIESASKWKFLTEILSLCHTEIFNFLFYLQYKKGVPTSSPLWHAFLLIRTIMNLGVFILLSQYQFRP